MTILYAGDYLEIKHDEQRNILYCRWFGFQETDKIVRAGQTILDHVRSNRISKVLNDNRDVRGPWQDAADWTAKEWFPAMMDAGLTHFAWILSSDVFAANSAKRASEGTPIVKAFHSYPEAYEWLIKH